MRSSSAVHGESCSFIDSWCLLRSLHLLAIQSGGSALPITTLGVLGEVGNGTRHKLLETSSGPLGESERRKLIWIAFITFDDCLSLVRQRGHRGPGG
jgi:hypothetical protein